MTAVGNVVFLGVDLGWYGKPSGLASIGISGQDLHLRSMTRLEASDDILRWIRAETGDGSAVVAVDAPLVIRNLTGIRDAERAMNQEFRRFHAGCHAANLGRPFAQRVLAFSRSLADLGFAHGAEMTAREKGRFQIEVHPHAATVNLFNLPRIVNTSAVPVRIEQRDCAACAGVPPAAGPRIVVASACRTQHRQLETRRGPDRCRTVRIHRHPLVVLGNPAQSSLWLR